MGNQTGENHTGHEPFGAVDGEISDELRFHLEGRIAELMAAGRTRQEAEAQALRKFGDPAAVAAECAVLDEQRNRRERRMGRIDSLRTDLKLGWRGLIRDRGVAAAVILTLGLTMGAVTALFSVTDAILLRPLPYPADTELVYVWQNDRATGTTREAAGTADFYDFRERSTAFESMAMFARSAGSLVAGDAPRYVSVIQVHHDLLTVLGIEPILGRGIRPEETVPGAAAVMLLTERMWRSDFNADPGIVGRVLSLGDAPIEVVGVLPDGASTVMGGGEIWTALQMTRAASARDPHYVTVVGRLSPGATVPRAHEEMVQIALELEEENPPNVNRGAFVEPVRDFLRGDLRATIWAVFAGTVVLLLIGAANVASLLSARATHRDRTTAVHTALGSGPGRTLRRGFIESAIMTGIAALVGVAVATLGVRLLESVAPAELLGLARIDVDLRVLAFTFLLSGGLATVFGLIPARHAMRQDLQRSLGHGAAGRRRGADGRSALIVGQAALATVLLVGSLLLGATLRNLMSTDLGFSTESMLRVSIVLPDAQYPRDFANYPLWPEIEEFQRRLDVAISEIPGVASHALINNHPLDPGFTNSVRLEGRTLPEGMGEITTRMISPAYFETVGVNIQEGRTMDSALGPADPGEVLLNRTAADLIFPEGDAIGARIAFWGPTYRTIVGVVEDELVAGHRTAPPPAMYTNLFQTLPASNPSLVLIRTQGDPLSVAPAVRRAILEIDPGAAVYDVETMEGTLRTVLARERFAGTLFSAFAAIALFLAAIGVHGVLAFTVARRTRELGVRLALGARRSQVRATVMGQALVWVGLGVILGVGASIVGARVLESLLYGVSVRSVPIYLWSTAMLMTAATLGALIPAMRASSVEPATSLRAE